MSSDSSKTDWQNIAARYPSGKNIQGRVLKVLSVGALVELEDAVVGFVPNHELDWNARAAVAREVLQEGQYVSVQVIQTEYWRQRILLSLRRASFDPWNAHSREYRPGSTVRARVTQFTRDDIVLEFEDHVSGFVRHLDLPKWIDKAEEVFEIGDWVEGQVVRRDDQKREIEVSIHQRLEALEQEIRDAAVSAGIANGQAPAETPTKEEEDEIGVLTGQVSNEAARLRILVVEDDSDERLQFSAILHDLGWHDIEEAGSEAEAIAKASGAAFDLVFMDLEMPPGDKEAGMRAAGAIKQRTPATGIILVSSNHHPVGLCAQTPGDFAGTLAKPFTYGRVNAAMRRFADTRDAGWDAEAPELRPDIPASVRFIQDISRAAHMARPLRDVLQEIIQNLKETTGAAAAAVFRWNRLNKEVGLEACVNIREEDFLHCKPNLNRSPVTDLIYQPDQPIFSNDIDGEAAGKFYHLQPLLGLSSHGSSWTMQSAIGELVGGEFDTIHTLFVFGDRRQQFTADHRTLARAAASIVGSALREHWIIQQVVAERRLTTLGGIVTSAAHELNSRLSALVGVNTVSTAWQQLRAHPEKISDPAFVKEIEKRIQSLRTARKAMADTVSRILGGHGRVKMGL